jgi:hypothetical protein
MLNIILSFVYFCAMLAKYAFVPSLIPHVIYWNPRSLHTRTDLKKLWVNGEEDPTYLTSIEPHGPRTGRRAEVAFAPGTVREDICLQVQRISICICVYSQAWPCNRFRIRTRRQCSMSVSTTLIRSPPRDDVLVGEYPSLWVLPGPCQKLTFHPVPNGGPGWLIYPLILS